MESRRQPVFTPVLNEAAHLCSNGGVFRRDTHDGLSCFIHLKGNHAKKWVFPSACLCLRLLGNRTSK